MEHEVFIPVPAETLREALRDHARVARCVPGLQQDADESARPLSGRLKVRVGGHTITYRGALTLTERAGGFTAKGEGAEVRGTGSAKLNVRLRLTETAAGTTVTFTATSTSTGRLTEIDAPTSEATGRRLLDRFAMALRKGDDSSADGATTGPGAGRGEDVAASAAEPGAGRDGDVAASGDASGGGERAADAPGADEAAGGGPDASGVGGGQDEELPSAGDASPASGRPAGADAGQGAVPAPESGSADASGGQGEDRDVSRAESGAADADRPADDSAAGADADQPAEPPGFGPDPDPDSFDDTLGFGDTSSGNGDFLVPLDPPAEAAHARRTMIGRSAEEVDHAPPRGRYAPEQAPESGGAGAALRWVAPAAALAIAGAVVVGRALRRRR
ncbi:SRPBCC domain-containing protein [Streptomyces sp. NBC_01716]|uniref:SRPBCC domain-containing protein n=1 Tax=Streptomyces sp. NBC_01716 TaxID=2975917 RepID=UPI002E35F318|nr:SRPBCC domain-containing protein [Streptomyces sp. NBC_01716]